MAELSDILNSGDITNIQIGGLGDADKAIKTSDMLVELSVGTGGDYTTLDLAIDYVNANPGRNFKLTLVDETHNPTKTFTDIVGTLTIIASGTVTIVDTTNVALYYLFQGCSNVRLGASFSDGFKFIGWGLTIYTSTVEAIGDLHFNGASTQLYIEESVFLSNQKVRCINDANVGIYKSTVTLNHKLQMDGVQNNDGAYIENSKIHINSLQMTGYWNGLDINRGSMHLGETLFSNIAGQYCTAAGGAIIDIGYMERNGTVPSPGGAVCTPTANCQLDITDGMIQYGPMALANLGTSYTVTGFDGGATFYTGSNTVTQTITLPSTIYGPFELTIIQINSQPINVTIDVGTVNGPVATASKGDILKIYRGTFSGEWFTTLN